LRPLAQTIEHVVSMQKCSCSHAIPVFREGRNMLGTKADHHRQLRRKASIT
jgi:hypothetical protein